MKTETKIEIAIGTIILGALSIWGYKYFKKECKSIEEKEKETKNSLQDLGLSEEAAQEIMEKDEEDASVVETMFKIVSKGSNVDLILDEDTINTESATNSALVVHVKESSRNRRKNNNLELLLEIPETIFYRDNSWNTPRIGDCLNAFKDLNKDLSEKTLIKCLEHRLAGYVIVSYKVGEENRTKSYEIDPRVYACYRDERFDGLTKFYEAWINHDKFDPECEKELTEWLDKMVKDEDYSHTNISAVEIYLAYKKSFPLSEGKMPGLTVESSIRCIHHILDEFEITRREGKNPIVYKYVLFHAPAKDNEEGLSEYYDLNKQNKVITRSFE